MTDAMNKVEADELAEIEESQANELAEMKESKADKLVEIEEPKADELAEIEESQANELAEMKESKADELAEIEESQADELAEIEESRADEFAKVEESEADELSISQPTTTSTKKSRKRKRGYCPCGIAKKRSKLVFCYGPNCKSEWVHPECSEVKEESGQYFYCSVKCKEDDLAAILFNEKIDEEQKQMEFEELDDYPWCTCRKKTGGTMIECSRKSCVVQWYHCECVNLEKIPKGPWICSSCKEIATIRKKMKAEEFPILEEAVVDCSDVPSPEITDEDRENASQIEQMLAVKKLEAKENGEVFNANMAHWLKLAKSNIHGRGVYAIKKIPRQTFLLEYDGDLIDKSEVKGREEQYKKEGITSIYFFTVEGTDTVLDATKSGNNSRFINHSCSPNVYSMVVEAEGRNRIYFYSRVTIPEGRELTVDYNFEFDVSEPRIRCKCGAKNCRRYLDL